MTISPARPDVSVVLPALNEGGNVKPVVAEFFEIFSSLGVSGEVLVMDGGSTDNTRQEAEEAGARAILQKRPGYGGALREGFKQARGDYILTLDCDRSHPPALFRELWSRRNEADILIASRFIGGGSSQASGSRHFLSTVLNFVFEKLLRVPVKDLSSGYRLYRRAAISPDQYQPENFNILQEILVRAYSDGFSVREVPLQYQSRGEGESHASVLKFGPYYLKTLYRLWLLRHSPASADYEHNAFDSRHFLQRYWQRQRHALISGFMQNGARTLDIGCGSSRLVTDHPESVALDLSQAKLKFIGRGGRLRVQADAVSLPFYPDCFGQVILSQLLPYTGAVAQVLRETSRVLRKDGTLIIGVPDAGRISWRLIGFIYNHLLPNIRPATVLESFDRYKLIDMLADSGFRVLKYRYILGAELIIKLQKIEECSQTTD